MRRREIPGANGGNAQGASGALEPRMEHRNADEHARTAKGAPFARAGEGENGNRRARQACITWDPFPNKAGYPLGGGENERGYVKPASAVELQPELIGARFEHPDVQGHVRRGDR